MADRAISQLTAASSVGNSDLFVLEQNNTAKKLTGQTLVTQLLQSLNGHGGISSITWTTSGTSGDGQYHNGTITYADASTSTFQIRDGLKGDTGDADHVYIKYASHQPTSNADMGDVPDDWIGIYSGTESTAPTNYTSYNWFDWKGEKGDTGDGATVTTSVSYMESTSGSTIPSGNWGTVIPSVAQGNYLWTRTILTFNDGTVTTFYSVARQGVDGEGQIDELAENFADEFVDSSTYNVGDLVLYYRTLYRCTTAITVPQAWDSTKWEAVNVEDVVDYAKLRLYTASVSAATNATIMTISDSWIDANTIVVSCDFISPNNVTSSITWASSAGSIVFTGSAKAATTATVILAKKGN